MFGSWPPTETTTPIGHQVFTSEAAVLAYVAHRIDLTGPAWTPEARARWERRIIPPAASAALDPATIQGDFRPGATLVFYIYRVGETEAVLTSIEAATPTELKANSYRFVVVDYPPMQGVISPMMM